MCTFLFRKHTSLSSDQGKVSSTMKSKLGMLIAYVLAINDQIIIHTQVKSVSNLKCGVHFLHTVVSSTYMYTPDHSQLLSMLVCIENWWGQGYRYTTLVCQNYSQLHRIQQGFFVIWYFVCVRAILRQGTNIKAIKTTVMAEIDGILVWFTLTEPPRFRPSRQMAPKPVRSYFPIISGSFCS